MSREEFKDEVFKAFKGRLYSEENLAKIREQISKTSLHDRFEQILNLRILQGEMKEHMDVLTGLKPFEDIPEFAPDESNPESEGFSEFLLNMKNFYKDNADAVKEDLIEAYASEGITLVIEEELDFEELDFEGLDFEGLDFDGLDLEGLDFEGD